MCDNLPLENKSFRWTKPQRRAAKKTSNCSKTSPTTWKSGQLPWTFHPRTTTIFMVVFHHISWHNIASQLLNLDPEVLNGACFGGTLFVSKALEPNQLVSTKVFNWRGVFDSGYRQLPLDIVTDGRHFFHTLRMVPLKRLQEKDAMVVWNTATFLVVSLFKACHQLKLKVNPNTWTNHMFLLDFRWIFFLTD